MILAFSSKTDETSGGTAQLNSALIGRPLKYDLHLASALIDQGNELFNDDIAEAAKLRRQLLGTRGKRMKRNLRRHYATDGNRKGGAGERLGLLRDQLGYLYLLIQGKKIGL